MRQAADITIDDARELVANGSLWPRLRDFLWDFAPQVHPSWIEDLKLSNSQTFTLSHSQTLTLSNSHTFKRFLLSSLGVEPCFHSFPKDDWSRLLLLDGATLESLVKWLGALACADALRGVTDGKTVRALKAALPGVYPEVFGYTAYFKGNAGKPEAESRDVEKSDVGSRASNVEGIIAAGWDILSASLSHLPESLLRRLALKLPKSFQPLDGRQPTADVRAFGDRMISKLLKLKFPEAYSLCCS